ncbi:MAG TPA: hypothetical protein VD978_06630 [Azospirillum sp.]|nr:hypothetical protein [Azospirillum sp.]
MSSRTVFSLVLTGAIAALYAAGGYAQDVPAGTQPTGTRPPIQEAAPAKTAKERLSDKASDEQRVNNCKVPLDRRGPKVRPEGCKPDDASATPTQMPQSGNSSE